MKDQHEQPHTKSAHTSMKEQIISRIKNEGVRPKNKWLCFCSDNSIWVFWIVTVIVGAIAFSESLYLSMHSGIEYYEVTHGTLFTFIVDSLPYIWIFAFLVMVLLAHYNMRRTKRGYKYPMWQIIISSLVFTIAGGVVLNAAGVSAAIDKMMGSATPLYTTAEGRQDYLWAHPEDGRITGMYMAHIGESMDVQFRDVVNREWVVATHELPPKDIALLISGKRVRLVGQAEIDGVRHYFYSCGVLPWLKEEGESLESIRENRLGLAERMEQFQVRVATGSVVEAASEPSLRCREIMKNLSKRVDY